MSILQILTFPNIFFSIRRMLPPLVTTPDFTTRRHLSCPGPIQATAQHRPCHPKAQHRHLNDLRLLSGHPLQVEEVLRHGVPLRPQFLPPQKLGALTTRLAIQLKLRKEGMVSQILQILTAFQLRYLFETQLQAGSD